MTWMSSNAQAVQALTGAREIEGGGGVDVAGSSRSQHEKFLRVLRAALHANVAGKSSRSSRRRQAREV